MGDIVLYDHTATSYERVWVPRAEVRYWLKLWRRQGRFALTLKQWKRQGQRPFVVGRKPVNRRVYLANLADSITREP